MKISHWQYGIGGLFAVGFGAALSGFLFLSADTTAVSTIIVVTAGGLVATAVLPQIAEFTFGLKEVKVKLTQVESQVSEQQQLINKLVETSMSPSVFHHLAGIAVLREYKYWQNNEVGELFKRELYHLKDRGFIGPETLEFYKELNGENLAGRATVTEIGMMYLKLRKNDVPREWLSGDAKQRENLRMDVVRALGIESA